jgi:O-acetyl-ADP-ribose deacetylase (regulator of RNase III)
MKIIYKHGNLLKAKENFIVQGCNAQGVMGSGVAKLLRDRDERVFTLYRKTYEDQGNSLSLGQVIMGYSHPHYVFNAVTQEFYGREPGRVYVDYDAVRTAMRWINSTLSSMSSEGEYFLLNTQYVAMPLIGAGLAQGKWSIISQIIEEEMTDVQPVVYLIDGIIPDGVIADVV